MENEPGFEFEFYLAQRLGGMTVAEMRQRMSGEEFMQWGVYYGRLAQREELARLRRGS